jgi:hypothetical protein
LTIHHLFSFEFLCKASFSLLMPAKRGRNALSEMMDFKPKKVFALLRPAKTQSKD